MSPTLSRMPARVLGPDWLCPPWPPPCPGHRAQKGDSGVVASLASATLPQEGRVGLSVSVRQVGYSKAPYPHPSLPRQRGSPASGHLG